MISILYICTHNRCRSILSEAITNDIGQGKLRAYSAGSAPSGQVHPLSLKFLEQQNIATDGLTSQSWDAFEDTPIDVVVTVCDQAAAEACPVWFGKQAKLHWGLSDPSKVEGSDDEIQRAFLECIEEIKARVEQMLALDCSNSERFQAQLKQLTN